MTEFKVLSSSHNGTNQQQMELLICHVMMEPSEDECRPCFFRQIGKFAETVERTLKMPPAQGR